MIPIEFANALSHISSTSPIAVSGERFQDNDSQKLYDDSYDAKGIRISHIDITPSQAILDQALIDYNAAVISSQQVVVDNQLAKTQIKEYLRSQLLSASPNPATIKTTIQSAVGANVNVSQAIVNMATLKGYDTSSNLGYIAACIDLVSILL